MTRLRGNARIDLPALAPDHALHLVYILEDVIAAIWHAHGPEMHDYSTSFVDDCAPEPLGDDDIF